jgi:hypothetical protein
MSFLTMKLFLSLASVACVLTTPASANLLFSDLGTGGDVYQSFIGWDVQGSGAPGFGNTENANLFTVAGTGSEAVAQIDLGVQYSQAVKTFTVNIWTDVGGAPGAHVAGSGWTEATTEPGAGCCSLVTIANITGLTLTGNSQYFMILAPVSLTDASALSWEDNSTGVTGDVQYSNTGGAPWNDLGAGQTLGAFDVQGAPEPGSLLLLGAGMCVLVFLNFVHTIHRRSRPNHAHKLS